MQPERTDSDVVTWALRRLNIIAGDAEADGFELENALQSWTDLHAELSHDEMIEFPADQIPREAFRSCYQLFADWIATSYGRQPVADPDSPMHPSRIFLQRRIAVVDDGEVREIEAY